MAWEDIVERLEGKGWLGVGLGALVLAPALAPVIGKRLRPVAKEAIKGCMALSERARGVLAEGGERFQDLVAEAKSEYDTRADGSEMMTMEEAGGTRPPVGEEAKSDTVAPSDAEEVRSKSRGSRKEEESKGEPA